MALALSAARASVVINSVNFPDPVLREALVDCGIDNGDGILTDEEIENATDYIHLEGCKNLKGLEYLKNLTFIGLYGNEEVYSSITSIDLSKFPKLFRLDIADYAITSLDATYSSNLWNVDIARCREFTSIKVDSEHDNLAVYLNHLPKLTSMENCVLNNVFGVEFFKTGIQDIDMSNHPTLSWLRVKGDDEEFGGDYELNSINVSGCDKLWELALDHVKLQSVRLNSLPMFYDISLFNCHTTDLALENMANLGGITCSGCEIRNLTIKSCPVLHGVSCADNSLHNLIIDDSPELYSLHVDNNMLMWLDMSNMQSVSGIDSNWFIVDNQQPAVQAVKISPTEVGLRVHERLDVSRVLNLRAKGIAQTPRETTIDGIRYFVFYDNGPDTPNLVGSDCGYLYDTKWPYTWVEGSENTKDNRLPVTLNVYSWTKHQAFLTLSTSRVEGKYGEPAPAAPTVTRSQDYDGKITFSSSNENVVKVNPDTGELTVVGAGTAIISVTGAETDYRLAPAVKTYTVFIDKATPVIAFPAAEINATYGETVPLNQLTVTWYEGTVTYSSANEKKAVVDAATGVVTTKGAGDVVIKGIAPETSNFYRAEVNYTLHIAKASPVFAFEKNGLTVALGAAVPENKLNVGLYDGEVQYVSSDETVATVDAQGVVTTLAIGEVTITATGAETENCNEAKKADYTLTVTDPSGISGIAADAVSTGKAYDLQGRKVNVQTARKGVYVVGGKKMVVK